MPIAREIFQEGLIIPPVRLLKTGKINQDVLDLILANVRTPEERTGDLHAQIGANQRGCNLLLDLVHRYSLEEVAHYMQVLLQYTSVYAPAYFQAPGWTLLIRRSPG
jgi:N-methylhydantoinase B/oxoprolinase/acetone carboxylase alpha subunit